MYQFLSIFAIINAFSARHLPFLLATLACHAKRTFYDRQPLHWRVCHEQKRLLHGLF
ncbi:hypothetical protein [Moraxella lacunata]|uniref:hypothetical protein n=1 Tax=Moraxella lacunata TaxID=477 RepID=UPI003EE259FE